jgi:hypothetical protein
MGAIVIKELLRFVCDGATDFAIRGETAEYLRLKVRRRRTRFLKVVGEIEKRGAKALQHRWQSSRESRARTTEASDNPNSAGCGHRWMAGLQRDWCMHSGVAGDLAHLQIWQIHRGREGPGK